MHFTRFAHGLKATLERERLTGLARRLVSAGVSGTSRLSAWCVRFLKRWQPACRDRGRHPRAFNAQTGLGTRYKAFYNQLAKPAFPRFMRAVFQDCWRISLRMYCAPWRAPL